MGCIQCTTLCFRSCVLFFRNEHAQSTSLGPKQCFWVVSCDSVAGRYKLLYRVLGCIKCSTLCFQSCILFSQRTCPIHFFRPKTKFLGGFARFPCREVQVVRSGFGMHKMHHFVLPKLRLLFSQRTCPILFFRPNTKFLWCFHVIPLPGGTIVRSGFRVHTMHHFVLPKLRLVFCNEHAQSTCFGPKLSFWVVSRDSVARRYIL